MESSYPSPLPLPFLLLILLLLLLLLLLPSLLSAQLEQEEEEDLGPCKPRSVLTTSCIDSETEPSAYPAQPAVQSFIHSSIHPSLSAVIRYYGLMPRRRRRKSTYFLPITSQKPIHYHLYDCDWIGVRSPFRHSHHQHNRPPPSHHHCKGRTFCKSIKRTCRAW